MVDEEEVYTNVASNLQNVLIVFLGFLLLISIFVFFPYYFLVDANKVVQNMDFLFNKIDASLDSLRQIFTDYSQYKEKLPTPINSSVQETRALKNNIFLIITQEVLQPVDKNISSINKNLSEVELMNNYYKIIRNDDLKNMKEQIVKLQKFTGKKAPNMTINISMLEYEDFLLLLPQKFYPASVEQKKADIQKEFDSLSEGVSELQIPIVGGGPFKLNQVLLLFPGIIAIGFPFISLQFKKMIILNRRLNDDKKELILSWLDPLQKRPDNFYAFTAMFIPLVIFLICIVPMSLLFYSNVLEDQNVLEENKLLFIPADIKNQYFGINILMGIAAFSTSYYLIFSEYFRKGPTQVTGLQILPIIGPQGQMALGWKASRLALSWNPNAEADIDHYNIYKGNQGEFTVTILNPDFVSRNNTYTDAAVNIGNTYYYRVAAVNINNKVGKLSVESSAKAIWIL